MLRKIAIAGASLAGLRTGESLRREGFDGEIVLIGAEDELPYDRPPLSKEFVRGESDESKIQLRDADRLAKLDLQFMLGRRASSLDVAHQHLQLDDGEEISFDALVIATGARAFLPEGWDIDGVFTLRTLDDARWLRKELVAGRHVLVIGGGFIGCEIAASARQLGLEVTLIEALEAPLTRAYGPQIGSYYMGLHQRNGVRVLSGVEVRELIQRNGHAIGARLASGEVIESDIVVVGLGVRPETEWLDSSGLQLDNGVVCDEFCAAAPFIYAAGDVARWPLENELVRVEHWTNASEQGTNIARNIMSNGEKKAEPYRSVPYVWSDQFGIKLQSAGFIRPTHHTEVLGGSFEEGRVVLGYRDGDRLTGAVTLNWPSALVAMRRLLSGSANWQDAVEVIGS